MLRSFSFDVIKEREHEYDHVAFLFYNLPKDEASRKYILDYALEIMEGYNQGRIDLSKKFHVWGYIKAIKNNSSNENYRYQKKKVYIFDSDDEFCTEDVAGISSKLLPDKKDLYAELLDLDELKCAVLKFKSLREDYIRVKGVDIVCLVKAALVGLPYAVNKLKELCEVTQFSEMIQIILASGYNFCELLGEE